MCKFPAQDLMSERAAIADLANDTQDPEMIQRCAEFVLRCDQLRLLHEEITGCRCWYQTVREAKEVA